MKECVRNIKGNDENSKNIRKNIENSTDLKNNNIFSIV